LLAKHYVSWFSAKVNKHAPTLTPGFLEKLEVYNWPGNVRELKNVIERAIILSDNNELDATLLPYEFENPAAKNGTATSSFDLSSIEKLHIQRVLNHTHGNRAETARLLNIGIATLYRKLKEYGLE
jgi:DNA-binding NtrC family response regulator